MIKGILASALLISTFSFAQKDCKCYENNYKIYGDIIFSSTDASSGLKEDYYAGVNNDLVQFSTMTFYNDGRLKSVELQTFPIADIDFRIDDMFGSRSKTEENDDHVVLTLGSAAIGGVETGVWESDDCQPIGNTSPHALFHKVHSDQMVISGKFRNKKNYLALLKKSKRYMTECNVFTAPELMNSGVLFSAIE